MQQKKMLLGNGKGQDSSRTTRSCGPSVGWMFQVEAVHLTRVHPWPSHRLALCPQTDGSTSLDH